MCDCKTELEAKLLKRFSECEVKASNHGAVLQGYGFALVGNSMRTMGYLTAELTADYPMKAGGTKRKKSVQNIVFTFCPYCGERYTPLEAEAA